METVQVVTANDVENVGNFESFENFASLESGITSKKKPANKLIVYRVLMSGAIITTLIILKHFFPEIYIVADLWLTEKLNLTNVLSL